MDMHSRKQYLKTLQANYRSGSKQEKTAVLNEYTKNTGHNRKYVIGQLNRTDLLPEGPTKNRVRSCRYGSEIMAPLVAVYEIFDRPCGQRLKPQIEVELERLRKFGEIMITNEVTAKLKKMSSATIDRKLRAHKRKIGQLKGFGTTKPGTLLKSLIPTRLTEWDTEKIGYLEVDTVAHCGGNVSGSYLHTVSLTEIATGWWEGEAIMGLGQQPTLEGLKLMRQRTPFAWAGIDSDGGSEFINYPLWGYCHDEELEFTRSRPSRKNDNAYVEQKNWTHVRKVIGYGRFDTLEQQDLINSIYRQELRLYKNFFQPVMKLKAKVRIGAKIKRKRDKAKTPYHRILESPQTSAKDRKLLKQTYQHLNPAELKRRLDAKVELLYQLIEPKAPSTRLTTLKREVAMVRF